MRNQRRWLVTAAILLLVVCVATTWTLWSDRHDPALTGGRWHLTALTADGTPLAIDAFPAWLSFGRGGTYLGDDGVNSYDGHFHTSGETLSITVDAGSAVGYAGPAASALEALDALIAQGGSYGYSVRSNLLTLTHASWRYVFQRP